ncbi:phytanoyl-CoA dioxygenase family protein [Achromobacter animicus]|uniref:phytanoyl-CoA dioxygenase family protein n=1 Tax=Achromobacter animicus TaxID=1389935 RepID=UPI0028AF5787|nr:phytanoyl-CoA dioxygenase family protein [Achromobacter animicus]
MGWLDYFTKAQDYVGFDQALEDVAAATKDGNIPENWRDVTRHKAWFDRPDALAHVETMRAQMNLSDEQSTLLRHWVTDGYVVLEKAIPEADIDGTVDFIENLFTTDIANPNISLLGYTLDPKGKPGAVPHSEVVKLTPAERQANARISPWRIHELWTQCDAAKRIYQNQALTDLCSLIFDRPAYPRSTINFYLGSQQELHQDMTVFHVFPGNYLIGAWVALEDISADSGPLRFAPKTHLAPPYKKFKHHPQTTLRTNPLSDYAGYYRYTNQLAKKQGGAKPFLAKKGDVFLWHGMLVHGGSPVNNPAFTRKSMVIHYLTEGVDQTARITGPFNWE